MKKKTIAQAVVEVLQAARQPMTAAEITQVVQEQKLYDFNAKDPKSIVRAAIERRCEGLSRKDAIDPRYFRKLPDGRYGLIEAAVQ